MDFDKLKTEVDELNFRLNESLAKELAEFEKRIGIGVSDLKLDKIEVTNMGDTRPQFLFTLNATINL